MSKKPQRKPTPLVRPDRAPRLDGDDLYNWGQVVGQISERFAQATQVKQQVASQLLSDRGYSPGEHLLTDDGYIVTKEQMAQLQRNGPHPVPGKTSQTEKPTEPESNPGSAS